MTPGWLLIVAWIGLATALLCSIGMLIDVVWHPQRMAVMNWVWPITALYAGPLAVVAYLRLGRPSAAHAAGTHHTMPEPPFWASVLVGTSHCGAGCTLGDILAELAIFYTGITLAGSMFATELIGDFTLAYVLGVAFQYYAIVPMRGLAPGPGIVAAVRADTLSLIAFEVGLFGWMALMNFVLFTPPLRADDPVYWFMMQIGMLIGFATSYPMNWWLIRAGIKEEM